MRIIAESRLLKIYNTFVLKKPLLGTALTSGCGMGVGNLICQGIMYHKEKKIEFHKVLQYSAYGLLISGPFLRYWWHFLELNLFKNPNTYLRPVKMMIVDQATTPWILNSCFLYYLAVSEGKSHLDGIENIKRKLMPICIESFKVWPLAMLLNFYIIPLHNRVLFSNMIAILWTAYMAYIIAKK